MDTDFLDKKQSKLTKDDRIKLPIDKLDLAIYIISMISIFGAIAYFIGNVSIKDNDLSFSFEIIRYIGYFLVFVLISPFIIVSRIDEDKPAIKWGFLIGNVIIGIFYWAMFIAEISGVFYK